MAFLKLGKRHSATFAFVSGENKANIFLGKFCLRSRGLEMIRPQTPSPGAGLQFIRPHDRQFLDFLYFIFQKLDSAVQKHETGASPQHRKGRSPGEDLLYHK
jgi:hypothetical protein